MAKATPKSQSFSIIALKIPGDFSIISRKGRAGLRLSGLLGLKISESEGTIPGNKALNVAKKSNSLRTCK